MIKGAAPNRDNRVLAFRDMSQSIAHPVNAAPLPSRFKYAPNGTFQASMSVADHQLHPIQAASLQGAQEVGPEGLGFRWSDAQANDLAAALSVGGDGYYCRDAVQG